MEFNDLIIFKTVASKGAISTAAKELGYVQPNVTERIKKLEHELGTPLFIRTNKGVSLLPSGEILLTYTNKILELMDQAKNELTMVRATYRIGTTQSILHSHVSEKFQEHYTEFDIFMESSGQLLSLLKSNKVDMIISYIEYTDVHIKKVYSTLLSMGLVKAPDKANIAFDKEFFFVSHDTQCPYRNATIQFLEKNNISCSQLQQVDSYSLIQKLVAQGKGVAFFPANTEELAIISSVPIRTLPVYYYTSADSMRLIPGLLFGKS